jgi:hypothetical protein
MLLLIFALHQYRGRNFRDAGIQAGPSGARPGPLSAYLAVLAFTLLILGFSFGSIRAVPRGAFSAYCCIASEAVSAVHLERLFREPVFRFSAGHPQAVSARRRILLMAHLPNWFLMIATAAGGYVCARIYLRYHNLYFLGMAHGVIGFLLYLVVPDTISHHMYVGPKWFPL